MSSAKQKVAVSISLIRAVWLFQLLFQNNYRIKQLSVKGIHSRFLWTIPEYF